MPNFLDSRNESSTQPAPTKESPLPVPQETTTDLDKIAYAVAMAETKNCTLGYGKMYNNCFGIKNGGTAPCEKIGKNRMCIYEKPADSYQSFKKIWVKVYGGGVPTKEMASKWTGNDSPTTWMNNVKYHYYN